MVSIKQEERVSGMEKENTIDILEDVRKSNQKNLMYQRISTILMLIFVVAVLLVIPRVISTLDSAKKVLNTGYETLVHMNDAISQLETAIDAVDSLSGQAENAMAGMDDALQKLNSIDIDTLNGAITDLSDVVEPMAKFFNVFN